MRFTKSFGFKIFLIIVGMQFIVVSGLGFYFITQISKDVKQKTNNNNYQTAKSVDTYINSYIRSYIKNLEILASMPEIVDFDKAKSIEILKSLVVSSMFISDEDVEIIDNYGNLIANNSLFVENDTINRKKYLKDLDPRKPIVGDFYIKKNIPTKKIIVAVQNYAIGYGALVADFSFKRFFDYIFPLKVGEKGFVFLTDKKGNIVVHKDKELVVTQKNIYSMGLPKEITYSYLDSLEQVKPIFVNLFGSEYLINSVYNSDFEYGIIVVQPKSEISSLVKRLRYVSILYIILSLLIATIISIFLSTKITAPLNSLSQVMLKVKDGNLEEGCSIKRDDEIGILAEIFDIMRLSIKRYILNLNRKINDLKKIHESLHLMLSERDSEKLILNYLNVFLDVFSCDSVIFFNVNNNALDDYVIQYENERDKLSDNEQIFIKESVSKDIFLYGKTKIIHIDNLSLLAIPIIRNNTIIKVLVLIKNSNQYFDENLIETAEIFANQMNIGLENIRLYSEEKKKLLLDMELENAKIIQDAIFPKSDFENEWLKLRFSFKAASQLNGDWFKFFYDEKEESFYYIIGDVTGHGVGAALLTGTVNSYFKLIEMDDNINNTPLGSLIDRLNKLIMQTNNTLNMTLILAKINKKDMSIDICNAGHNHAILFRIENGEVVYHTLLNQNNRLGDLSDKEFTYTTYPIKKGDRILFYTDGIIEWISDNGKQWGKRNLIKTILNNYEYDIEDIIREIDFAIENKNIDEQLNDDYTFTFIEIK